MTKKPAGFTARTVRIPQTKEKCIRCAKPLADNRCEVDTCVACEQSGWPAFRSLRLPYGIGKVIHA